MHILQSLLLIVGFVTRWWEKNSKYSRKRHFALWHLASKTCSRSARDSLRKSLHSLTCHLTHNTRLQRYGVLVHTDGLTNRQLILLWSNCRLWAVWCCDCKLLPYLELLIMLAESLAGRCTANGLRRAECNQERFGVWGSTRSLS